MKKKYLMSLLTAAMVFSACGNTHQPSMPDGQKDTTEESSSEAAAGTDYSSEEAADESDLKSADSEQSGDTSVSSVSEKEDDTAVYAAYLKEIQDNKDVISAYTWQNESYDNDRLTYGTVYPIAMADVYGDGKPELIFMRASGTPSNGSYFEANLVVDTYEDSEIRTLYDERLDIQVAGGTNFCIFTGMDRSLYRYDGIGDEGWTFNYSRLNESDGALRETDRIKQNTYPDDTYENWTDTYFHNDSEISKDEYERIKKAYYDNLDRILLSGGNDDEVLFTYTERYGQVAMTYDEAVEKLTALSGVSLNKDDSSARTESAETAPAGNADYSDVFRNMSERSLYFSSGVGGWNTDLDIGEDGIFTGHYSDSDMGDTGDGYPNGTCYDCEFMGRFVITEKIDDYSYKMTMEEIAPENPNGMEWIDDGVRYIASEPYGLSGGKEFLLYLPGLPMSKLTDDGLGWYTRPRGIRDDELPDTLPCYGIYNTATGDAFYSG